MNKIRISKVGLFKLFFISILLVTFIFVGKNVLLNFDFKMFFNYMESLTLIQYFLIFALGILAVSPMFLYDFVLVRLLKLDFSFRKILMVAWLANTSSNLIGLGGVAGTTIRTLFYRKDRTGPEIVKAVSSVTIFLLSGLSILSLVLFTGIFDLSFLNEYKYLYIAIIIAICYFPVMFLVVYLKRNFFSENFSAKYMLSLVVISLCEWSFILLFIYFICLFLHIDISIIEVLPVFLVASVAALLSMIPGGLGSFDFIFLLGFTYFGIDKETTLLVLLIYRFSYFFFPFACGIILALKLLWNKINQSFNNIPNQISTYLGHKLLTILVFLSGVILLVSAAVPSMLLRISLLNLILPSTIINISHLISVTAGFTLLGLSRGIDYKDKRAWYITLFMLIVGAVTTYSKGLDYEEALFVLAVAFILFISKKQFYRESFVLTWGKLIVDNFILFFFLGSYLLIAYINLPQTNVKIPAKYLPYILVNSRDIVISAVLGFAAALLFFYIAFFKVKRKQFEFINTKAEEEKIKEHFNKYGGTELSHLVFLHDKYLFWAQDETVLFIFQPYADKLVILGDPVGEKSRLYPAIEELLNYADQFGYTLVFYQVNSNSLSYLHENGFDFFKLGEEGFTDISTFSLSGKRNKGIRALYNKFEREEYSFEIIEPPYSNEFFTELKELSQEWLKGRKEKGFSLGYFDEDYIKLAPVAIIKNNENKMIAFASIMPNYNEHTISIDLMRHKVDAPKGIMDFMFVNLIEWFRSRNFHYFNVGMTPLANVGLSKYSFTSEKIAAQIYQYGQFLYHFQGLRSFKEKYVNSWTPKFLAYHKKTSLPITMLQITSLISRSRKN
ncbi:bifunctional lysylphosphatidylglycerol flippase/synthetase MprF [Gottfriedia acidiceleris]|uniref:bifunctional lysylphosphatidylglycerol flippase/synthetase MprF n=1 Tax=Gottfriedia acidiceleris TaxID=371036 RepID=UPI003D25F817